MPPGNGWNIGVFDICAKKIIKPRGIPAGITGAEGFIKDINVSTYCFCKFLLNGSIAFVLLSSFQRPFSRSVTRSSGSYTVAFPKRSETASILNNREEERSEFNTLFWVFEIISEEEGLLILFKILLSRASMAYRIIDSEEK